MWRSLLLLALFPTPVHVQTISGPSPYASCTITVPDAPRAVVFPGSEVEPSVAINPASPRNMIAVWQQDRWSVGGARGLAAAYSTDGGQSWTETALPLSACADSAVTDARASDPWVSIGPDGTAYVVGLGVGAQRSDVLSTTSRDGGRTWSKPVAIISDAVRSHFNDKESVTADPLRAGVAYAVWDRTAGPKQATQPAYFSETTDGGATWSHPVRIVKTPQPNSGTIGNIIAVGPHGRLYDIYEGYAPPKCGVIPRQPACDTASSTRLRVAMTWSNGAGRWSRPRTVAAQRPAGLPSVNGVGFRTGEGLPAVAIAPASGVIDIAWVDGRFSGSSLPAITLAESRDRGKDWTLSAAAPAGSVTPALAVDGSGDLFLSYLQVSGGQAQEMLAERTAAGWTRAPLGGRMNLTTAPISGGYFLGDYQGLATLGGRTVTVFAQTTGNPTNRTSMAAAVTGG